MTACAALLKGPVVGNNRAIFSERFTSSSSGALVNCGGVCCKVSFNTESLCALDKSDDTADVALGNCGAIDFNSAE